MSKQHKSISAADVMRALEVLELGDMVETIQEDLQAFREEQERLGKPAVTIAYRRLQAADSLSNRELRLSGSNHPRKRPHRELRLCRRIRDDRRKTRNHSRAIKRTRRLRQDYIIIGKVDGGHLDDRNSDKE
ncbi:uncharacterized protein EV420DRAFT_1108523 [Desarmillaria tabescens]|uniref:Uncharacterized protein n=1 Tax=Armillaria tabescens TaxID=1929756 RepID=A0AA39TM31_ARMTA|nr:uncharacterized protein EV420DRAFT_1108523 [Desarmillaria tabescens]KAK0463797.1 hypothetical protein EV420DRAFT_1108523 [Desarmillaria tabescens]